MLTLGDRLRICAKGAEFLSPESVISLGLKLSVTSRAIVGAFFEEIRLVAVPVLERSERRPSFQHGFRELAVIEEDVEAFGYEFE